LRLFDPGELLRQKGFLASLGTWEKLARPELWGSDKISYVIDQVGQFISRERLFQAGDRVAVAVSGGADSVALLRLLLELRQELGIVLSVAHFNHGIRGAEADADQQFVMELAGTFGLEMHLGSGDAPAYAREHKVSLETGARELRHRWFGELVGHSKADKVATAHTLDDQAETVLMRILRGAGARGLAGIFPQQEEKHLVRPLLSVTRSQVEAYLKGIGQTWHEDSTNRDLSHTRNRIRHQLLPLLEKDFNPALRQTLGDLAEVARAETEYWSREVSLLLARMVRPGKPSRSGRSASGKDAQTLALGLAPFRALPVAVRRHLLQGIAQQMQVALEFKHIQQLMELSEAGSWAKKLSLPGGIVVIRTHRELQFMRALQSDAAAGYKYSLPVPGEVNIPELGSTFRARALERLNPEVSRYNFDALLDRALLAPELTIRNWRAGDRFFPAKTRSPKKLKELLQADRLGQRLSADQRKLWPVAESAGEIVWVRGFAVPDAFIARTGDAVVIEETEMRSGLEK
jgi:tRNA(Ile)-lysidine synthase